MSTIGNLGQLCEAHLQVALQLFHLCLKGGHLRMHRRAFRLLGHCLSLASQLLKLGHFKLLRGQSEF